MKMKMILLKENVANMKEERKKEMESLKNLL